MTAADSTASTLRDAIDISKHRRKMTSIVRIIMRHRSRSGGPRTQNTSSPVNAARWMTSGETGRECRTLNTLTHGFGLPYRI